MSETSTAAQPSPPAGPEPREPRDRGGLLAYLIGHQSGVVIVVALVISLLVGAALIRYQGVSPWFAYETLIREALVVDGSLTRTLQKTAPLVLTGLAVVLPLRVGLFNIGGQGQFATGAIMGARVAYVAGGAGFLGAAARDGRRPVFGGARRRHRRCPEVLARGARGHLDDHAQLHRRRGHLLARRRRPARGRSSKTSGIPQTELIPEQAQIGALAGIPIGFRSPSSSPWPAAWMLSRTTLGFKFNTVGANKSAAGYAGIQSRRSRCCDGARRRSRRARRRAREPRARCTGTSRPSSARSASTASPSRCSPGPTRWRRSRPPSSSASCARARRPAVQHRHRPEIVDVLLAIILLMVSIPVLGKWLFRRRTDEVSVASTSGGTDMGAWVAKNRTTLASVVAVLVAAYVFLREERHRPPSMFGAAWLLAVPLVSPPSSASSASARASSTSASRARCSSPRSPASSGPRSAAR